MDRFDILLEKKVKKQGVTDLKQEISPQIIFDTPIYYPSDVLPYQGPALSVDSNSISVRARSPSIRRRTPSPQTRLVLNESPETISALPPSAPSTRLNPIFSLGRPATLGNHSLGTETNNYRPLRLFLATDREGVAIYPDNLSMSVDVETPNQQLPTAMISMSFRMTLNDAARILSTHPQDEIRRQL
jgi:hypothetical protein